MPENNFCASPWFELVPKLTGTLTPCCRSSYIYGDWNNISLKDAFNSLQAQKMRQMISSGVFPDRDCEVCYHNNTYADLKKLISKPLQEYWKLLKEINSFGLYRIARIKDIFTKKEHDDESKEILRTYFDILSKHEHTAKNGNNNSYNIILNKLRVIGESVEDFLNKNITPRHIGLIRQPNFIAICNARCIHCPGYFAKTIIDGIKTEEGLYKKYLSFDEMKIMLQESDSIVDFFMNGSELLFYKHWKSVVKDLYENHLIRIRLSTNGILLNKSNSNYLLRNNYIGRLNVSIDGATAETVNIVRRRVNFDQIIKNIKQFMKIEVKLRRFVTVSLSFVLADYNFLELPKIVEIAHLLSKSTSAPAPHIVIQPMSNIGHPAYGEFMRKHHHSTISKEYLVAKFKEMQAVAEKYNITVVIFYRYMLKEFIDKGCPLPEYKFLSRNIKH